MSDHPNASTEGRLLTTTLEDQLIRTIRKALGIGLLVGTGLAWAALLSRSSADLRFGSLSSGPVANFLGPLGAITSDLLLQCLGFGVASILFITMFWGLELVSSGTISRFRVRASFAVIAVAAIASAASAIPTPLSWPLRQGLGGLAGELIFSLIVSVLAGLGFKLMTPVVGLALFVAGGASLLAATGIKSSDIRVFPASGRRRSRAPVGEAAPAAPFAPGSVSVMVAPAQPQREAARWPTEHASDGRSEPTFSDPWFDRDRFALPAQTRDHPVPASRTPFPADDEPQRAEPILADVPASEPKPKVSPAPAAAPDTAIDRAPAVSAAPPGSDLPEADDHDDGDAEPFEGIGLPRVFERWVAHAEAPKPQAWRTKSRAAKKAGISGKSVPPPKSARAAKTPKSAPRPAAAPVAAKPATAPVVSQVGAQVGPPPASRVFLPPRAPWPAGPRSNPAQAAPARPVPPPPAAPSPPPAPPAPRLPGPELADPVPPRLDSPPSLARETGEMSERLAAALARYGVAGRIVRAEAGPLLLAFEIALEGRTNPERVIALASDLARAMDVGSARATLKPSGVVEFEVARSGVRPIRLRDVISSNPAATAAQPKSAFPLALGLGLDGQPVTLDLSGWPGLILAGSQAAMASGALDPVLVPLLLSAGPDALRLSLIDGGGAYLARFNGLPHLDRPVLAPGPLSLEAMSQLEAEIGERRKLFSALNVATFEAYNGVMTGALERGEMVERPVAVGVEPLTGQPAFERRDFPPEVLPRRLLVIGDLSAIRLSTVPGALKALEAVALEGGPLGLHLILATTRTTPDVLPASLKALMPIRLSRQAASRYESRAVIDADGAESLLVASDMLVRRPRAKGGSEILRVHPPVVSPAEIGRLVASWQGVRPAPARMGPATVPRPSQPPHYPAPAAAAPVLRGTPTVPPMNPPRRRITDDSLYAAAVKEAMLVRRLSADHLQRRLGIGYDAAADLMDRLAEAGVTGSPDARGRADVLYERTLTQGGVA